MTQPEALRLADLLEMGSILAKPSGNTGEKR